MPAPPRDGEDPAAALARVERALAGRFPHRMLPDLSRMRLLMDLLGSPQAAYPSVHITGTNGKTSTARMVDALLRSFGIRTGRYTSPHLESVTERICVDGAPLPAERFAAAYDEVAPFVSIVDERSPERVTFFELLTAMGFAAFADTPVEVAVVEVGMGGTWDATNVVDGAVSVATTVSLDHRELGDTVAQVATEKAGIIRAGAPFVMAAQRPDAAEVLLGRAAELGAPVVREGTDFAVVERAEAVGGQLLTLRGLGGEYREVFLPLYGEHQARNAACALATTEAFLGGGGDLLDAGTVRQGFATADSPGRLEVVRSSPTVLLDGAHNPAGAQALAATLAASFSFSRLVGVVGILGDKDVDGVLEALEPVLDAVVVTQSTSPRAMAADDLGAHAVDVFGVDRVSVAPRLDEAITEAVALADETGPGAGVLVTGSLVTVGEARALLRH